MSVNAMSTSNPSIGPAHPGALWGAVWSHLPQAVTRALREGGTALEVDCGTGLGCLALATTLPAARVRGHDADPEAILRARSLAEAAGLGDRLTFAADDSLALPHASFDLITAEGLLRRRPDAPRLLNAIRNALLPEGAFLLLEQPASPRWAKDLQAAAILAGFSRFRALGPGDRHRLFELRR